MTAADGPAPAPESPRVGSSLPDIDEAAQAQIGSRPASGTVIAAVIVCAPLSLACIVFAVRVAQQHHWGALAGFAVATACLFGFAALLVTGALPHRWRAAERRRRMRRSR